MIRTLCLSACLMTFVATSYASAQDAPPAQPAVDQPAVDQPAVDQPAVDQPAVDQPAEPRAPNTLARLLIDFDQRLKMLEEMYAQLKQEEADTEVVIRVLPLQHADANSVLTVLFQAYDETTDQVKIVAAPQARSMVIRGGKKRVEEIISIVELLDVVPPEESAF